MFSGCDQVYEISRQEILGDIAPGRIGLLGFVLDWGEALSLILFSQLWYNLVQVTKKSDPPDPSWRVSHKREARDRAGLN